MKIKIYESAAADMEEIFAYIHERSPQNARKVIDRFFEKILLLSEYPQSGVVPKDRGLTARGYRMLISDDYLIFYLVAGDIVQIRRVLHGASRYAKLI